jgi:DNA-binding protein HU-beta
MTKADIVSEVSKNTGISKVEVSRVIEEFMTTVKDSMGAGENVYLRGFGCFLVKTRTERIGQDLNQMKPVVIPEHKLPVFRPYDEFKNVVKNNGY